MGSASSFAYANVPRDARVIAEDRATHWSAPVEEAAYLAGIIDGEGTIGIYDLRGNGSEYHLRLLVSNSSRELAEWVHRLIGGSKYFQVPSNPRYRGQYQVVVVQRRAAQVIRSCLPFLIIKRPQAMVALEFIDGFVNCRGRAVPEAEITRRRTLAERISGLNQPAGFDGVTRHRWGRNKDQC